MVGGGVLWRMSEADDDVVISPAWRELSAIQRDILVTLALRGRANNSTIHRRQGRAPERDPVTTKNLDTLARKGLVAREPQGKQTMNWLTPAGWDLIGQNVVDVAAEIEI